MNTIEPTVKMRIHGLKAITPSRARVLAYVTQDGIPGRAWITVRSIRDHVSDEQLNALPTEVPPLLDVLRYFLAFDFRTVGKLMKERRGHWSDYSVQP